MSLDPLDRLGIGHALFSQKPPEQYTAGGALNEAIDREAEEGDAPRSQRGGNPDDALDKVSADRDDLQAQATLEEPWSVVPEPGA